MDFGARGAHADRHVATAVGSDGKVYTMGLRRLTGPGWTTRDDPDPAKRPPSPMVARRKKSREPEHPPLVNDGVMRRTGDPIERDLVNVLDHADNLRSIAARAFDEARDDLRQWAKESDVPEWMRADLRHAHTWQSPRKLARLVGRWGRERFDSDDDAYASAEDWRRQNDHLYRWECDERHRALAHRDEVYRVWARRLASEYGRVVVEDVNFAALAKRAAPEDKPTHYPNRSAQRLGAGQAARARRRSVRRRRDEARNGGTALSLPVLWRERRYVQRVDGVRLVRRGDRRGLRAVLAPACRRGCRHDRVGSGEARGRRPCRRVEEDREERVMPRGPKDPTKWVAWFVLAAATLRRRADDAERAFIEHLRHGEAREDAWRVHAVTFDKFLEKHDVCKASRYRDSLRAFDLIGDAVETIGVKAARAAARVADPEKRSAAIAEMVDVAKRHKAPLRLQTAQRIAARYSPPARRVTEPAIEKLKRENAKLKREVKKLRSEIADLRKRLGEAAA